MDAELDDATREAVICHLPWIRASEVMAGDVWLGELRLADGRRYQPIYADGNVVIERQVDGTEIAWQNGRRV